MFDTMTLTKIVGGFCGAFLVFLLGGWAAEAIYHEPETHAEGEEVHQAYVIPVSEGGAADEPGAASQGPRPPGRHPAGDLGGWLPATPRGAGAAVGNADRD